MGGPSVGCACRCPPASRPVRSAGVWPGGGAGADGASAFSRCSVPVFGPGVRVKVCVDLRFPTLSSPAARVGHGVGWPNKLPERRRNQSPVHRRVRQAFRRGQPNGGSARRVGNSVKRASAATVGTGALFTESNLRLGSAVPRKSSAEGACLQIRWRARASARALPG